jgi:hypothetical protein
VQGERCAKNRRCVVGRKTKKGEFVKAEGAVFEVVNVLAEAVYARGGTDEDLRRVLSDKALAGRVANTWLGRDGSGTGKKFKFLSFMREGEEKYVFGNTMLARAGEMEGKEAGETEGRYLLDHQELIPMEYCGKKYLVVTGWRHPKDFRHVARLECVGLRWLQNWSPLDRGDWDASSLVVRLCE